MDACKFRQASFQIDLDDNICVALSDLEPGTIVIHGAYRVNTLDIPAEVKQGHKLATCSIQAEQPIVKYGIVIGIATQDIRDGEWVHLHNCRSLYDKRSSTLDIHSGAPTDLTYG